MFFDTVGATHEIDVWLDWYLSLYIEWRV
jgi:hypothetical protein